MIPIGRGLRGNHFRRETQAGRKGRAGKLKIARGHGESTAVR